MLPRKKPERRNLDHRSVECGDKSNPSDLGRIDLGQSVPANVRLFRKRNGLRLPNPLTKLWIVTCQSGDRIFDKARSARER